MAQEKRDLIIFSLTRWDQPNPGSSVSLIKELSRHYRIFYIERPYSIKDVFKEWGTHHFAKRRAAVFLRKNIFLEVNTGFSTFTVVTPGLNIPVNFLPKGWLYNLINGFNNFIVKQSLNKLIKQFDVKDYLYLNFFYPALMPVVVSKYNPPALNIYYITNDIRYSRYFSKHGEEAEQKALQQTDIVLVTSRNHFKRLFSQKLKMYYFPNGVDYHFYESVRIRESALPYDLVNIGHTKIILFAGYISAIRIDYLLIKAICENFPNYLLVLVGTYDEEDLIKFKLEQIPNLLILGNRRYESIPAYIKIASATIIPYLCNELNQSVYPLKLNEYLAMGKPVVTTNFCPDLESLSEVIYISGSYEEFLQNLERALNEDDPYKIENRIKVARQNAWANRVRQFKQIVDDYLNSNKAIPLADEPLKDQPETKQEEKPLAV